MRIHSRIPAGAVRNADVFGSPKLKPGERVVDLEVEIEHLPARGKLVIKESTVVSMARKLNYRIETEDEYAERNADLLAELEHLRARDARLTELESALAGVNHG